MATPPRSEDKRWWLDDRRNVTRLVRGFYIACAIVLALDLLVHRHHKFDVERLIGFYAFYGLIACVALVLIAKALRRVLMRPENYYDR